jgi:hypothetical protein
MRHVKGHTQVHKRAFKNAKVEAIMFHEHNITYSDNGRHGSCEILVEEKDEQTLIVLVDHDRPGLSVTNGLEIILETLETRVNTLQSIDSTILHKDSMGNWARVTYNPSTTKVDPQWHHLSEEKACQLIAKYTDRIYFPGRTPETFIFESKNNFINIPHTYKYHSTTGMSWGYIGSGPSDLAINILTYFFPLSKATHTFRLWNNTVLDMRVMDLHHEFVREFLVRIPEKGGTLIKILLKPGYNNS